MKYPLHKYQIWIGNYHLGQGYDPSTEPQMIGEVIAPNLKVACVLYGLRSMLGSIEHQMSKDGYVDNQSCRWFYNFETNSNSWTGKYFETREEALKSFSR